MKKIISKIVRTLKPKKTIPLPKIAEKRLETCDQIRAQGLSFLSKASIYSLVKLVEEIETGGIDGDILEAGCALGGSSIAMCSAKNSTRALRLYDTFEMIPPPSDKDDQDVHDRYEIIKSGRAEAMKGEKYYGYLKDIPERVTKSFDDFGYPIDKNLVTLHKGLLQDTMHVNEPIALAHIDVDWYEPVYTCLERVIPNLSQGGAVVLDDYFAWSGCRKATDDFFASRKKEFTFCSKYGHLIVQHRND